MFTQSIAGLDALVIEAAASEHVTRETMRPVYDAIESFVTDRRLIVSNIPLLLGIAAEGAKNRYIIYGTGIHRHVNDLANAIAARDIYTIMYTNVRGEDYMITVRGVPLVQLYGIRDRLFACMTPTDHAAFLLYPPEFELIGVYHKLFSPAHFAEWEQMGEWEKKLRAMLPAATGGRGRRHRSAPARRKAPAAADLNAKIYKWLIARDDYVIVGTHGVDILMGRPPAASGKIRLIAANRDKLTTDLMNMIAAATGADIKMKIHGANYPSEGRLSRAVITADRGKWSMPIADVYNNGEFEIVPYTLTGSGAAVGYECVIKYFLMIDLWFMRIMKCLGFVDVNTLTRFTADIYRHLAAADAIPPAKFTRELYLGKIRDAATEKKIVAMASDSFPYSPEQWRFQRGKYRT